MKRRSLLTGLLFSGIFETDASALPPPNVFAFRRLVTDEKGRFYLATNRGLYCKENGSKSWRELSLPDRKRIDAQVLTMNDQGDIAVKTDSGTCVLPYGSSTWKDMHDEGAISLLKATGGAFFAVGDNGRLWRADNMHWTKLNDGSWSGRLIILDLAWVWGQFFLATDQGLLESRDGGRSWVRSPNVEISDQIETLISTQGQWLYMSSRYHAPGQKHLPSLFVRNKQGGTWRRFAANKFVDHRAYSAQLLAVDGAMTYVKMVGGTPIRERLFRVQDAQSWTEIDLLFAMEQRYIGQMLVTRQHLYALTDDMIFRSADKGNKWEPFVDSSTPPFI